MRGGYNGGEDIDGYRCGRGGGSRGGWGCGEGGERGGSHGGCFPHDNRGNGMTRFGGASGWEALA
jgi:hypothetical protein